MQQTLKTQTVQSICKICRMNFYEPFTTSRYPLHLKVYMKSAID